MCEIRLLRADEIDVRVQQVKENGALLLLYKDARCDMSILDEVFGMTNWKRRHEFKDNKNYCTVSIWDAEKKEWIDKEDVGVESLTDKDKGQASDAFKRACFNVGIGRELYTSPFIWVSLQAGEIQKYDNRFTLAKGISFSVSKIVYNDRREISGLEIRDNKGNVRFDKSKAGQSGTPKTSDTPTATPPNKPSSTSSGKRIFNPAWLDDDSTMLRMYQWLHRKESDVNSKDFRPYNLIERTYVATPDEIITIVDRYQIYKTQIK